MEFLLNYSFGTHRNHNVIFIEFKKDRNISERIKSWPEAQYSSTKKCWYVPDNRDYRDKFGLTEKPQTKMLVYKIHPVNQHALDTFIQTLQLKAYSPNTIRTYKTEFSNFLYALKNNPVTDCTESKIRSYLLYCINVLKLTEATISSRINAVKFYFEQVLLRDKIFMEIPRPKKKLQVPKLFSKEEIVKLLKNAENLKHKTMLLAAYSSGLRVSEVVALRLGDIDSNRMVINILCSKGKKDRIVPLSQTMLKYLRIYVKVYKPQDHLFEGQYEGMPYSTRGLQSVFEFTKQKANITRRGGVHALRHSYATHLLDKGVDIIYIQKILGHNDLKTTLRYLHVTTRDLHKIESPLDDLDFN